MWYFFLLMRIRHRLRRLVAPLPKPYKDLWDLTAKDLKRCPVWELALDMEGTPGFDDYVIRPRPDIVACDESVQLGYGAFVHAEFVAADGRVYSGTIELKKCNDVSDLFPTIIVGHYRVGLTLPAVLRDPSHMLRLYYRWLKTTPERLFPLSFRACIPVQGFVAQGVLEGFVKKARVAGGDGTQFETKVFR